MALIIKRLAEQAGMEAGDLARYRCGGFGNSGVAAAGVSERPLRAQTGHRSLATLRKQIRDYDGSVSRGGRHPI